MIKFILPCSTPLLSFSPYKSDQMSKLWIIDLKSVYTYNWLLDLVILYVLQVFRASSFLIALFVEIVASGFFGVINSKNIRIRIWLQHTSKWSIMGLASPFCLRISVPCFSSVFPMATTGVLLAEGPDFLFLQLASHEHLDNLVPFLKKKLKPFDKIQAHLIWQVFLVRLLQLG